jgi:hypothetical protein
MTTQRVLNAFDHFFKTGFHTAKTAEFMEAYAAEQTKITQRRQVEEPRRAEPTSPG